MACALTQGFTIGCTDGIAGIKSIRLIEWEYLDTGAAVPAVLTAVSGTLTVITPRSSKKFWKYELPNENKDYFKETWNRSDNGSFYWPQELQITIRKLQASLRNEIRLIGQNRIAAIVHDRNGKYWLLGQLNGLTLDPSSEANSGSGRGEFNGYVLKFKGEEDAPAQEVDSTIIAALTN